MISDITRSVGQRIRGYRIQLGLSQEKLAEKSGCHPTYIGQIERGEKNATLESMEKISVALGVPLSTLFEKLGGEYQKSNIPLACYEFLLARSLEEQQLLYQLLLDADKFRQAK